MFPIEIYLLISCVLLFITSFYYLSKVKEFNANLLKFIIPIGVLFLFIIFFINYYPYVLIEDRYHAYRILLTFFSQLCLFISCGLYVITITYYHDDVINLDNPSLLKARKGDIEIGKVMYQNERRHKFFLSLEDLEKHMFVCGSTGTGKSNFVQNFLINFKNHYNIPFLLIEFKGEYIFLQEQIEDVLVFKPGEDFSINIFNPEGAHPEIHAERIFDILKSGQFLDEETEYSPQMQKVLVDILTQVCKNQDLQSWEGFYQQCKKYLKSERKHIPMLAQTLISIRNRIRRFSIGPLKAIFSSKTEFKIKELLNKNIIIDLSSIIRLGGEKEDALFFLNMILKYLWDENLTKGGRNYKGIKHLTIVEDAQYFAPQDLTKQTKLTTYLEDIALLQRGTGECLISVATRPQVSEEILANCGVLVIFKSHMEKEFQCELLNLDEINQHYLSILEKGRCLVRVNSIKRPFLLWNPYIHRNQLNDSEISRNNTRILEKSTYNNLDVLREPYSADVTPRNEDIRNEPPSNPLQEEQEEDRYQKSSNKHINVKTSSKGGKNKKKKEKEVNYQRKRGDKKNSDDSPPKIGTNHNPEKNKLSESGKKGEKIELSQMNQSKTDKEKDKQESGMETLKQVIEHLNFHEKEE